MVTTYLVENVYPHHDAYRQCLLCLVFVAHVYMLGMYVAMVWIVDLLQLMSNVRLQDQHRKFTKWTEGAEAAINDHIRNYTSKVKKCCRRLKWWFNSQHFSYYNSSHNCNWKFRSSSFWSTIHIFCRIWNCRHTICLGSPALLCWTNWKTWQNVLLYSEQFLSRKTLLC